MKRLRLFQSQSGLTLIELAAVMTVIGVAVVGLTIGFQNILLQYEQDAVRNNLLQYSNTMLKFIEHEVAKADSVRRDDVMGYSRIQLIHTGDMTPYMTISGDPDEGIRVEGPGVTSDPITFPNKGDNYVNGIRTLKLKSFNIDTYSDSRPALTKFKESFWTLTFVYELVSKVSKTGITVKEEIVFEKSLFITSLYVDKKLAALRSRG